MFKFSIETMQIWPRNKWRMCCLLKLDKSLNKILSIKNYYWNSIEAIFVKNYEIRFSKSNYMHILEYLCRVSFLTTLHIYKDYFKSHREVLQKNNPCILWPKVKIALVHHILCRSYCIFTPRVLWPRRFLIFTIDELKNFAANNLPQVGVLVTYWNPCIIDWSSIGIRALNEEIAVTIQVQLSIRVRVQLLVGIGYWDSFYL